MTCCPACAAQAAFQYQSFSCMLACRSLLSDYALLKQVYLNHVLHPTNELLQCVPAINGVVPRSYLVPVPSTASPLRLLAAAPELLSQSPAVRALPGPTELLEQRGAIKVRGQWSHGLHAVVLVWSNPAVEATFARILCLAAGLRLIRPAAERRAGQGPVQCCNPKACSQKAKHGGEVGRDYPANSGALRRPAGAAQVSFRRLYL